MRRLVTHIFKYRLRANGGERANNVRTGQFRMRSCVCALHREDIIICNYYDYPFRSGKTAPSIRQCVCAVVFACARAGLACAVFALPSDVVDPERADLHTPSCAIFAFAAAPAVLKRAHARITRRLDTVIKFVLCC